MLPPRKPANPVPWVIRPWPLLAAGVTAMFLHQAYLFHLVGARPGKVLGALAAALGIASFIAAFLMQEET